MIPTTHFDETTSPYQMTETARYWEQKARDAEEGYNTLLQDHTILKDERDALAAHVECLTNDIMELIESSEGVYGLHLNGDPAAWNELLAGGRFEGWLMVLSEAPATSLANHRARIQRETCDRLAAALRLHGLTEAEELVNAIGETVHQQAEESLDAQ